MWAIPCIHHVLEPVFSCRFSAVQYSHWYRIHSVDWLRLYISLSPLLKYDSICSVISLEKLGIYENDLFHSRWEFNVKNCDHSERGATERNSKASVYTWPYKANGWCRLQWSLLRHICFHSEISKVVEKTLFLVSGSMHCKFMHFYWNQNTQMRVKSVSHVRYQQALVQNLVGDVCNPIERSPPGTADREERLNKAPHIL
jgi:hypothetical protein